MFEVTPRMDEEGDFTPELSPWPAPDPNKRVWPPAETSDTAFDIRMDEEEDENNSSGSDKEQPDLLDNDTEIIVPLASIIELRKIRPAPSYVPRETPKQDGHNQGLAA